MSREPGMLFNRLTPLVAYSVFIDLLKDSLDYFAGMFEWAQYFLSITQPIRVNLQHSVEVLNIR